jgi:hypothetical protein
MEVPLSKIKYIVVFPVSRVEWGIKLNYATIVFLQIHTYSLSIISFIVEFYKIFAMVLGFHSGSILMLILF